MKSVFYGLAVAVVALSASAFTNVNSSTSGKRLTTVYVTGQSGSGSNARWIYDTTPQTCTESEPIPCQLEAQGDFSFPDAPNNSVLKSDVNDPDKVDIVTTKPSL